LVRAGGQSRRPGAGKGVLLCRTSAEALAALDKVMKERLLVGRRSGGLEDF
jgi:phosphoribosylamine-glycine ligase